MRMGAITGAIVAHHPLDGDAHRAKPLNGPAQEADGGDSALICKHLDVGKAGGVIHAAVAAIAGS